MAKLVHQFKTHPQIRELALKIVRPVKEKNWRGEASAILNYSHNHIRYVKDVLGVETLQTPIKTLQLGQGDCDDTSILVATLLAAIGHPTRFIAVGFTPNSLTHVFVETKIGSKWYAMETTMKNWPLGRRPKGIKKMMIWSVKRK